MKELYSKLKQILIISPEPWSAHFVSKHHYAITLSAYGSTVYFMGPPSEDKKDIEIKPTEYKDVFEIIAPKIANGLRFYPSFVRKKLESDWLKNAENKIGQSFSAIWLFENSRFYDMNFAKGKLKIYHQVDSNQDFNVKKAATTADICFCTTDFIKSRLIQFNTNTFKIHHGVSVSEPHLVSINTNINKPVNILTQQHIDRLTNTKINAVLVGNLDIKYLDVAVLRELISSNADINFHLVGNYNKNGHCYLNCRMLKNAQWWGKVDSHLIPEILQKCDVLLVLYKPNTPKDKEQLASPHKIMEYLNSGKVTVASYTDEYKDKTDLIEMVNDNSQYISKFDAVIKSLSDYNGLKKQAMRIKFAQAHTYSRQLKKIISYLDKNKLI